jgi:hypothetical protein
MSFPRPSETLDRVLRYTETQDISGNTLSNFCDIWSAYTLTNKEKKRLNLCSDLETAFCLTQIFNLDYKNHTLPRFL